MADDATPGEAAAGEAMPDDRAPAGAARVVAGSRFARSAAALTTGSVVGQVAVVAVVPLLSRLFAPEELGTYGAFSAVQSILFVVACLRVEQGIAVVRDDGVARWYLRRSISIALGVGAAVVLVTAALQAGGLDDGGIRFLAVLLGVAVVGDAVRNALWIWHLRRGAIRRVARSRAAAGVSQAAGQVVAGLASAGATGLAVAYALARLLNIAGLSRAVEPIEAAAPEGSASPRRFLVFAAPAALINALALQAPMLAMAATFDAAVAGAYLLASRIVVLPMSVIGQALTQSVLAEVRTLTGARGAAVLRRRMLRLTALGAAVGLPVVVVGPAVATAVLGAEWRLAGELARWLMLGAVGALAAAPFASVLMATGRQATQLVWDAVRLALIGTVFVAAAVADLGPTVTVGLLGIVLAACYAALAVLVVRAARAAPAPDAVRT